MIHITIPRYYQDITKIFKYTYLNTGHQIRLMAYSDKRSIDALKVVCDNHNNETIDNANEIIEGHNLFKEKCDFLEKELHTILWASRKPEKFEEFREHMNIDDLNVEKVNKLWNKTIEYRLKYKKLFEKFYNIQTNAVYNYYMFLGMLGGIRLMNELYDNCTDRDAVLWACMDDMEVASETGEDYDLEAEFKKMKEQFINDNINDVFTMRLNLDS